MAFELKRYLGIAAKILAALILFIALVVLYARRVSWVVSEEYRIGSRTSTDGDSLGIPIGTFGLGLLGTLAAVWLFRVSFRGGLATLGSQRGLALVRRVTGLVIGLGVLLVSISWLAWAIWVAL